MIQLYAKLYETNFFHWILSSLNLKCWSVNCTYSKWKLILIKLKWNKLWSEYFNEMNEVNEDINKTVAQNQLCSAYSCIQWKKLEWSTLISNKKTKLFLPISFRFLNVEQMNERNRLESNWKIQNSHMYVNLIQSSPWIHNASSFWTYEYPIKYSKFQEMLNNEIYFSFHSILVQIEATASLLKADHQSEWNWALFGQIDTTYTSLRTVIRIRSLQRCWKSHIKARDFQFEVNFVRISIILTLEKYFLGKLFINMHQNA